MTGFARYAIYHAPRPGALSAKAANWLGWDVEAAAKVEQPSLPGLPLCVADLTAAPCKYGFHGTLRAPFRPAPGLTEGDLRERTRRLAAGLSPVRLERLEIAALGTFLALRPLGDTRALQDLAEAVVRASDDWLAPLTDSERARRRPDQLTARQRELLDRWSYPYVMEEFRFHMTLTGPMAPVHLSSVSKALSTYFGPAIQDACLIEDLCLFGERPDGAFEVVARYQLTG